MSFGPYEQTLDGIVDALAGLDHEHDLARPLEQFQHLFERVRADDLGAFCGAIQKFVNFGSRPVIGDNGVAVVVHVHDQVLSHDCESDKRYITFRFHALLL